MAGSAAAFAPVSREVQSSRKIPEPAFMSDGGDNGGGRVGPPRGFSRDGDGNSWSDDFFWWWENHNPFTK